MINDSKYFSTRDIVNKYPNNVGLQNTFKSFVNQRKIRPVKIIRIKLKPYPTAGEISVPISCFNSVKIKKQIEDYLVESGYKMDSDRKASLNTLIELITEKINAGENNE